MTDDPDEYGSDSDYLALVHSSLQRSDSSSSTATTGDSSASSPSLTSPTLKTLKQGKWQSPRKWTPEEDERLKEVVGQRGESHWKAIAADVSRRAVSIGPPCV